MRWARRADARAYERLIMDVIRGDQTLFMRGDEVRSGLGLDRPDHPGLG